MAARMTVLDPPADEPIRLAIVEPPAGAGVREIPDPEAVGHFRLATASIPKVDETASDHLPVDVPLGTWFG